MHAILATLAIVILTCKMAAAGDSASCHECTAETAAKCAVGADAVACNRELYDYLKEEERKSSAQNQDNDEKKNSGQNQDNEEKKSSAQNQDNEEKKNSAQNQDNDETKNSAQNQDNDEKKNSGKNQDNSKKPQSAEYQRIRGLIETNFPNTRNALVRSHEAKLQKKIPADDALLGLKMIEFDETIPLRAEPGRISDWIAEIRDWVASTDKKIDQASIDAFNKRFSKKWKAAYVARVKRENGFVDVRSAQQDDKQQYLISEPSTSDKWCATFESKELGFHRGCGVVVEGYEFKTGCHNMSGPYEGVTYCRCEGDKCNDKAGNDQAGKDDKKESTAGVKLNGKITFILMATVLAHFM